MAKKHRKRKKKSTANRVLKIILIILIVLAVLCAGVLAGAVYMLGNLNTTDFTEDDSELGISEEIADQSDAQVMNIALFGVDTRDMSKDTGRSDAIMILSLDERNNAVKMVSILRDSKVAIEGHGNQKITHAYMYGGPTLAIKTINQNFNMDIREYVTVNFNQLAEVVDSVGGVELELTQKEVSYANKYMRDQFPSQPQISGSGVVTLTGPQAVSYARIRHIDSDSARADRQQEVLSAVFRKIATMPKSDYPSFIRRFLGIVETSLSYNDILGLSTSSLALKGFETTRYTIPDNRFETDLWGGIDDTGAWVWMYDLNNAAARLYEIIYGENGADLGAAVE